MAHRPVAMVPLSRVGGTPDEASVHRDQWHCLRRSLSVQTSGMVLDGNTISCDAFACGTKDDFDGVLSDEDTRVRYHILGWQFVGAGDSEKHYCPTHA